MVKSGNFQMFDYRSKEANQAKYHQVRRWMDHYLVNQECFQFSMFVSLFSGVYF